MAVFRLNIIYLGQASIKNSFNLNEITSQFSEYA